MSGQNDLTFAERIKELIRTKGRTRINDQNYRIPLFNFVKSVVFLD